MRKSLILGSVWLLLPWAALGQQAPTSKATTPAAPPQQPAASATLTNLLDAKIHAEWEAIKKRDKKAMGELLTEDFIGVEADGGGERYKWKALSELDESAVADYTLSFLKVVPLGPNAAFARYESFIRFPPKSQVKFEKVLIGEIWVKRDGQWKCMHYQETRVK